MTVRSIGSLTVSFGLVAIPVKLYSATQSAGQISFNLLHKNCGSRLKQQYTCLKDGQLVERDDMDRGYEYAKDQYVAFTPEEIKALEEVGNGAAEILHFVPLNSIDPLYFDKTYYLGPDKGGAKPYALFSAALAGAKRCAIGRWAHKGKDHIVMIRAVGDTLALHQLKFNTEVRQASEVELVKDLKVNPMELKLARQLIDQQKTEGFDPSLYTDNVQERVQAAIEAKIKGEEMKITKPKAEPQSFDLMGALKASLAKLESPAIPTNGSRKPRKRIREEIGREIQRDEELR
jgi:DNA end-binding protein Ku